MPAPEPKRPRDKPALPQAEPSAPRAGWWKAPLLVALAALAVRVPFMSLRGFPEDQAQFAAWAEVSRHGSQIAPPGGLEMVYSPWPNDPRKRLSNYPPGYLLVLRGLAALDDLIAPAGEKLGRRIVLDIKHGREGPGVQRVLWMLKLPPVLADAALAALLCLFAARRLGWRAGMLAGGLYALAPPVIFDSGVWGQVESVFVLPLVAALEFARQRRLAAAAFWAAIAMLFKAQMLMFAPLFFVLALVVAGADIRRWAGAIGAAIAPFAAAILLFGGGLEGVKDAYAGAAFYFPYLHLNGFSVWFIVDPLLAPALDTMSTSYAKDTAPLALGATARQIGMAALLVSWALIGLNLWRRRCDAASLGRAARLLPLCFFVLSTQMHERYLVPAVAAWLWAYSGSRRWWIGFAAMCFASTVNLIWTWPGFGDNAWTRACNELFHSPWLGLAAGQWCATALVAVLALTAMERDDDVTPKAGITAG